MRKPREKTADTGHILSVRISEARDQECLLYARTPGKDQEHYGRGNRQEPGSESEAEAWSEEQNSRVHWVPHVTIWAAIHEVRIPPGYDRIGEIGAKGDKHPHQPRDTECNFTHANPARPIGHG